MFIDIPLKDRSSIYRLLMCTTLVTKNVQAGSLYNVSNHKERELNGLQQSQWLIGDALKGLKIAPRARPTLRASSDLDACLSAPDVGFTPLTISASKPTVDTKYPLAQKCSPLKFRCLPRNFLAIVIAFLPFM